MGLKTKAGPTICPICSNGIEEWYKEETDRPMESWEWGQIEIEMNEMTEFATCNNRFELAQHLREYHGWTG